MLNKRAAAEQLRKYATVARLIREQRTMQKRAEKPGKTVPKPSFGSNHKHVRDQCETPQNQKTNYELQQEGNVPRLSREQRRRQEQFNAAVSGSKGWWPYLRTWIFQTPDTYDGAFGEK